MSLFKNSLLAFLLVLSAQCAFAADRVNLNTADAETLAAAIIGIGPAKASAIVAHREQYGRFKSVDDLTLVKGVGQSTVDKNRDRLTAAD
ncbi:MAG: ComEA family DNA-binding protein [Pseudomonadota bacterium]